MFLAGDIGGTKTKLALFDAHCRAQHIKTFPSSAYGSLEAIVTEFLAGDDHSVRYAAFGVAGPVVGGRVDVTNLPWRIDEQHMATTLQLAEVRLINDLAAIAHAVPYLEPHDLHALNDHAPEAHGTIAILAPGTGLGEAFLTWDGQRYQVHASEGGHCDFAPASELQLGLLSYLQRRYGHVSVERVCSGMGLPNIYAYLKDSGYAEEPDWLAARLAQAADPTPVIVNTALDAEQSSALCRVTLQTFIGIMAAQAGNLALTTLASGGVYLGGGIPARILPALDGQSFMRDFSHKGRMSVLLERVPVYVILNADVALIGAARHGLAVWGDRLS